VSSAARLHGDDRLPRAGQCRRHTHARSRTPFARLGAPTDVAGAVAFLATDDALYISGTNLLVDGGWMAY
jgi:NAD(P)-dependent dehydrogenase (short-subunit alcohol dehydrogenase family)